MRSRALLGVVLLSGLTALILLPSSQAQPPKRSPDQVRPVDDVVRDLNRQMAAEWSDAGVKPTRRTTDLQFLRRASLDASGVVPSEQNVVALASKRKRRGRRQLLIKALLHGEGYARFMATRWANLLVGRGYLRQGPANQRRPLLKYLRQQFAANTAWDVVVRSLLTATGTTTENGAAAYLLRYPRRPEEMTGNAMRVFQGQQVQCAQCHDHPYKSNWKQKDFWAVAAFFARARPEQDQMTYGLSERDRGEVRIPGPPGMPGPVVEPRFITGESIDPGEGDYRREELARIITSPKNPWFARATVNRVWSFFFGAGFTDPDDLAKPILPKVLAILEKDFKDSGYDMRRLCTIILSCRAYQLSSQGSKAAKDDQLAVFARGRLRPLTLEQLWWSTVEASGLDQALAKLPEKDQATQRKRNLERRFFQVFAGQESGAVSEYSLSQALMLLNGPTTNDVLWVRNNPLFKRLLSQRKIDDQVATLFMRVVGRPASRSERAALRKPGGLSSSERSQYLQDVFWALLNSSEFLYNH